MLDSLKKPVKASLIFIFVEHLENPTAIEVLEIKKKIEKEVAQFQMEIMDLSINEYKVYECKIYYETTFIANSISVYYNRANYYICGNGKNSVEIIFCDFINKEINSQMCKIEYNEKLYTPNEDFGLVTRRRLNFVNIDIKKLKLPLDLNGNKISLDENKYYDFQIPICVSKQPKVLGIYKNTPFVEPIPGNIEELIIELQATISKAQDYLCFQKNKDPITFMEKRNSTLKDQYISEIKNSYDLEKKLTKYFNYYKETLNDLELKLYDLYSEFMILFPDFKENKRDSKNINHTQYSYQYYFSKCALLKFCNEIPETVSLSLKAQLKYAASRCLRTLIYNSSGLNRDELFALIDCREKDTIYHDAIEYNKKFIELISEKSEIFPFFLQNNSGSGINLLTNKSTARLSMLTIDDIKSRLKIVIPTYVIRILYAKSFFNACTINEVRITCVNEINFFGGPLTQEQLKSSNDQFFNWRYTLANLFKHENFGHTEFSLNFYAFNDDNIYSETLFGPLSPIVYYMPQNEKEMVEFEKKEQQNKITIIKGESGIALEYYFTRGNKNLMLLLRKPSIVDFTELFKMPFLQAAESLSEFISKLEKINIFNSSDYDIESSVRFDEYESDEGQPLGFPTLERLC